jgi:hypothetical protein
MSPTDGELRKNAQGKAEVYRDPPGRWLPYAPYKRPDVDRAPEPEDEFRD